MEKRKIAVGFTATGQVTQHFVKYLVGEVNSELEVDKKADPQLRQGFLDTVERINFLYDSERYENKDIYDQLVEGRVGEKLERKGLTVDIKPDFSEFYKKSDLIIETAAAFGVQNTVPDFLEPVLQRDYNPDNNPDNVFNQYCQQVKSRSQSGEHPIDKAAFFTQLEYVSRTADVIKSVKQSGYSFGNRIEKLLPFNLTLLIERAGQMEKINRPGPKLQDIPVYIVVTNQPELLSTIVSYVTPSIRQRTIACSGFDTERLLEIAASAYEGGQYKDKMKSLQFFTQGIHDKGMMIPSLRTKEKDIGFDEQVFLGYLQNELNSYAGRALVQHRDTQDEVDRSLIKTIINAGNSLKKGLTRFPSQSALCDGYFHSDVGLFLSGEYCFRNGFAEPWASVEGRVISPPDKEKRLNQIMRTMKELRARLLEKVVGPYIAYSRNRWGQ